MAYTKKTTVSESDVKKSVDVAEEPASIEAAEGAASTSSVILRTREKIPQDAIIMVKNMTGGKLVYTSKKLNGYQVEWTEFGEEVPIEMSELYYMKNTDRRFFTENWIEVDINVLKDLQMDRFYKDTITVDEINNMFDMDTDELIRKVKNAKKNVQNAIGIKAIEMIEQGQLTNIHTISALEDALGCELYVK